VLSQGIWDATQLSSTFWFFIKIYFFTTNVKNLNWGRKGWTDLCLTDMSCHMAWHAGMLLVNIHWTFISDLHGMACWHAIYIWLAWHGMACFGLTGARKVKMRRIASHVRRNASQNARFRGSNASHATRRVAKVVFCQGGLFFATHCVALRHIASHCNALRRIASQYCSFYFFLWLKTEKSSHVCRSFVLGEESKFGFKNTFSDTCIFFSCWSILMSTVSKLFSLEKRIHCMTLEHPQMGQYYQKLTKQTCKNWKIYQTSRKVKINPSYFSKK